VTIQPSIPQNLSILKNAKFATTPAETKDVAGASVPSDSAEINFNAPAPSKAESLYAATAAEASDLKGTLDPHQPGELIILTRPGFSLAGDEGSVVADFGATVLGEFDTPGGLSKSAGGEFLHIKLPAGVSVEEAMAAMSKDERVQFAVPNHTYGLPDGEVGQGVTNDPDLSKLWGLHNEGQTGGKADADIDAPEAWQVHTGRTQAQGGHITAVIDTGIDYNHPDLKANMWTNPGEIAGDGIDNDGNGVIDDVHGYNAFADSGDPMDGHGHGSHCAGTIAGVGNNGVGVVGVNHNANLMAVKIFSDSGSTTAAAIIRGIQYSTKMGARITSNSWGGGGANAGIEQAFKDSSALHIIAAGNSGYDNDKRGAYPANYPGDHIIAVAATDHNDGLARFSQYGKVNVDIGAPGVDVLSTVPGGYDTYSGTSMATPHVAGAATLIASAIPDISNNALRAALLGGADKTEALTGKVATDGRLNVNNSLQLAKTLDYLEKLEIV
jgi:subtilisin family serine protease